MGAELASSCVQHAVLVAVIGLFVEFERIIKVPAKAG
jgi:hypothetical protein